MRLFDHCISNPPYQIEHAVKRSGASTSNSRRSTDIFPNFQQLGSAIALNTAMIYPATWQKDIAKGFGEFLVKHGLRKAPTHRGEEIFEGIFLPVSLTYSNSGYSGPIESAPGVVLSRGSNLWIDSPVRAMLHEATKDFPKLRGGFIKPPPIANAATCAIPLRESREDASDIALLLKRSPGKAPDSKWFYAAREDFTEIYSDYPIGEYRVAVRAAIVGRQSIFMDTVFVRRGGNGLRAMVFPPGEAHGVTWLDMRSFKTLAEAENFSKYVSTMLAAHLTYLCYSRAEFAKYVPELGDYSAANPIFQSVGDLRELQRRLCELFEIADPSMIGEAHG